MEITLLKVDISIPRSDLLAYSITFFQRLKIEKDCCNYLLLKLISININTQSGFVYNARQCVWQSIPQYLSVLAPLSDGVMF